MALGAINGSQIGPGAGAQATIMSGAGTYAMPSVGNAWAVRFTAQDTRDILTVYVWWNTVTAAGVVECRIETIDATSGKPSGTLYDANATKSQAPSAAAWQAFTFATPPTTGLTAGVEYAVVLITTTAGTAHTLITGNAVQVVPQVVLTASADTPRTNFTEAATSYGVVSFVMEDSEEVAWGNVPVRTRTIEPIYGTVAVAMKFVVPTGETFNVSGIRWGASAKTGTPAGDLILEIIPDGSSTPTKSVTIDKDSLSTKLGSTIGEAMFPPVALAAGTYRVLARSPSSANSSNCWNMPTVTGFHSNTLVPGSLILSKTSDMTNWADTDTAMVGFWLVLNSVSASAGGGLLTNPGMSGGIRG